jgi:serine/threonine-protein kinase 11
MSRTRALSLPFNNTLTGKTPVNSTYGEHRYIKKVNQYQLIGRIGEGASSRVFFALDDDSQPFAVKRLQLKQLKKAAAGAIAIQREIRLMARLKHPNIISLHEVIYVQSSESFFLVLDYANCGNLDHLLKTGFRLTPDEIGCIFKQVVNAVSYLHQNGIVHQDLKPQNILLTSTGNAFISDFGTGHNFSSCARGFGSPAYQAPEFIDRVGNEDDGDPGKEDVWSLGVTLYFLHFQKYPFEGSNVYEIGRCIRSVSLSKPPECTEILWDLITKMLTVDSRKRIGIQDVLKHDYVKTAMDFVQARWRPTEVPVCDSSWPVRSVQGTVVNSGFEVPLSLPRVKHFDAPFPE